MFKRQEIQGTRKKTKLTLHIDGEDVAVEGSQGTCSPLLHCNDTLVEVRVVFFQVHVIRPLYFI